MEAGNRVKMSPMWKFESATGTIKQVRKDGYIVVIWDGVNGEWHYTEEQTKNLEVIKQS